jgi:hypothetical protein
MSLRKLQVLCPSAIHFCQWPAQANIRFAVTGRVDADFTRKEVSHGHGAAYHARKDVYSKDCINLHSYLFQPFEYVNHTSVRHS